MRAIVTVIGKDAVGILAKVSTECANYNANVIEVTQSVIEDLFAMIMLVDISKLNIDFAEMAEKLAAKGENEWGLKVLAMHEDIFNCMHHI
ncbi:ACT domain-containing protein [Ruminococcus sp. 210702-SL.1.03]|mgnify:FL=1|uniref:ACT domain-containing protein n=1 Tax=Ruminococcus sp. 210702-SL.1.03 TaxID=2883233 RepID=UPI001D0968F4|nr:ACT domain-containing protein [Ruminococcus sp. 210702-SL.1.03]MCB6615649.1 ACT domain-containing protein [Ruminococcus sp. 210702-SL.1.03]